MQNFILQLAPQSCFPVINKVKTMLCEKISKNSKPLGEISLSYMDTNDGLL